MKNQSGSFNLNKGTIEFWVKENKLDWDNDKSISLLEVSREGGKIVVVKDKKNIMRAIYQKGEEKSETSVDVSDLSKQERHQVVFTWNRENNEINLFLDGKKVDQNNIK